MRNSDSNKFTMLKPWVLFNLFDRNERFAWLISFFWKNCNYRPRLLRSLRPSPWHSNTRRSVLMSTQVDIYWFWLVFAPVSYFILCLIRMSAINISQNNEVVTELCRGECGLLCPLKSLTWCAPRWDHIEVDGDDVWAEKNVRSKQLTIKIMSTNVAERSKRQLCLKNGAWCGSGILRSSSV